MEKKIRLVKRLKNRIETKSGHKIFNNSKTSKDQSVDFKIKNSPYRKSLSKRSLSFKKVKNPTIISVKSNEFQKTIIHEPGETIEVEESEQMPKLYINHNLKESHSSNDGPNVYEANNTPLSNRSLSFNVDAVSAYF